MSFIDVSNNMKWFIHFRFRFLPQNPKKSNGKFVFLSRQYASRGPDNIIQYIVVRAHVYRTVPLNIRRLISKARVMQYGTYG